MKKEVSYEDNLIRILDDSIILKHYYLPFISKVISFTNIETIETRESSFMETVLVFSLFIWRLFGFGIIGDQLTWFPFDLLRGTRDKIFLITYKNQRIKSGFTVEDSATVEEIFKEKEWFQKIFSQNVQ